ncbi:MAG: hypothetical protein AAF664_06735, partial [Planctomycetota bacterium]
SAAALVDEASMQFGGTPDLAEHFAKTVDNIDHNLSNATTTQAVIRVYANRLLERPIRKFSAQLNQISEKKRTSKRR